MFTRKISSLICQALLPATLALAVMLSVSGNAGGTSLTKAPAYAEKGTVVGLLAQLRQAQTAEEAAALLDRAKLSKNELRQLDREMAKPEWSGKLAGFRQTVRRSTPARPTASAYRGKSAAQVLDEKRQVLAREQKNRIRKGEQTLHARVTALPATAGPAHTMGRTAGTSATARASLPATAVRAQVLRPEWPARISGLEPRTPTVGQPLTIQGSGFGNGRGTAMFLVGEHLFEAEVTGWTSSRITVRVPRDVLPWDTMADVPDDVQHSSRRGIGRECQIWIRLQDERWGAFQPLNILPDLERLTPTITAITPGEATPGGSMMIEGANFGRQQGYGSVALTFGHRSTIDLDVREWRNDQIVVRVADDISRLLAMTGGTVKVTNRLMLEAERSGVSFVPAEEVQELQGNKYVVMCHPALHPLFCWAGDRREFTAFDMHLRNGWTVDEIWIDVREIGVNAGAYFEQQPERGDTRAYARVVVWADGLSRAEATPHMIIKGPRGTSPQ